MKEEEKEVLNQDVINEEELEALSGGISAIIESQAAGLQGVNRCCNGTTTPENSLDRVK